MSSFRIGPETERLRLRSLTSADAEAFYLLNTIPSGAQISELITSSNDVRSQ